MIGYSRLTNSYPHRAEIGRYLYIFETERKKPECIVSAHGGYICTVGSFRVPKNSEIYFYADHGHLLSDPGLAGFEHGPRPKQILREGELCPNYMLTKYQGRHNPAGETYDTIDDKIDDDYDFISDKEKDGRAAMHIVTVRNRRLMVPPWCNLDYVVQKVQAFNPNILYFHCSFCRGNAFDRNAPVDQINRRN